MLTTLRDTFGANGLFKDNSVLTSLDIVFHASKVRTESMRQKIHQEFSYFYNNDYLEICNVLKQDTLNNPYSADTLNTIQFRHINILKKILKRVTSGIYTKRQIIRYAGEVNEELNKALQKALEQARYYQKVKDIFRKAVYYNVSVFNFWKDLQTGNVRIDIVTPNDFTVQAKQDYNDYSAIKFRRCDEYGNIYYSVWTETEHYIQYAGSDKKQVIEGNSENKNPYAPVMPQSVLRIEEGIDFYGEPNWNLYLNQKYFDIRLTDFSLSECKTAHQMYVATNCNLGANNTTLSAGTVIDANQVKATDVPPTIETVTSNIDYEGLRENIDWAERKVAMSEGLSSQSSETDTQPESGIKRMIDEVELQETRDEMKEILYGFEIDAVKKFIMVYNYGRTKDKLYEGDIEIIYSEDKSYESVSDKTMRREMQKKYFIGDEVDFVMQDLELSEKEAIDHVKKRVERQKELNLVTNEEENLEDD